MTSRQLVRQVMQRYRSRLQACRLKAMVPTQVALAQRTKINRTTISALENNRLFLSAPYALAIAEALNCRLDELYERVPEKHGGARKDKANG